MCLNLMVMSLTQTKNKSTAEIKGLLETDNIIGIWGLSEIWAYRKMLRLHGQKRKRRPALLALYLFSITTRFKSTMGQTLPHRYWVALSRCGRAPSSSAFLCIVVDMVVRRWFACCTCLRKLRFWNGSNMISMLEPSTRVLICEHGQRRGLDLFGSEIQAIAGGLLVFCALSANS